MRGGFIVILLASSYLKGVSTVRDYSVDRLSLEGPGEAQIVANPLPEVEEEAEAGANYVDCLRRWEEERQRQLAFMEGFTHLVSAQRRVQRLHVSMRGFGHGRNLTVLVSDLQQRLSLLSRAGLRYAERLKLHVDELHPQLSERCKNSTLDVEDLRKEILSAVSSRRRAGTLKKLKADVQQQTMEDEQKRLVAAEGPEAVAANPVTATSPQKEQAPAPAPDTVKSATPVVSTSTTTASLQNAVPAATNVKQKGKHNKKKAANVICWDGKNLANELNIKVDDNNVRQSMLDLGLLEKDDIDASTDTFTRGSSSGTTRSLGLDSSEAGTVPETKPAIILEDRLQRLPEHPSSGSSEG